MGVYQTMIMMIDETKLYKGHKVVTQCKLVEVYD